MRGVGLLAGGSKFDVFWWARWGVVLGAKLAMTLFLCLVPFGRARLQAVGVLGLAGTGLGLCLCG